MVMRRKRFKVFICYSRSDIIRAREVYEQLRRARFDPWMDTESIPGGMEWELGIERALRESQAVLVLTSQASLSRDGFAQREIHSALRIWESKRPGGIYLIPVRLEECGIHERLARFQHVDLYCEGGWERLMNQLKALRREFTGIAERVQVTTSAGEKVNVQRMPTQVRPRIPTLKFQDDIESFLQRSGYAQAWSQLDRRIQRYVRTAGCKFEAIAQIVPVVATRPILGFECLALGPRGQNFGQIISDCRGMDPGALRIALSICAVKTIAALRTDARSENVSNARKLKFSLNLDPAMLDSPLFKSFLHAYGDILERNVLFEVNEKTTTKYLTQLKNLRADFELDYAADDLNNWESPVRTALLPRVALTKMDHLSVKAAMEMRGDDPQGAINQLRAHKVSGKPLVVEGIDDPDYLLFLERHWDYERHGELYGQGYVLEPGLYWEKEMLSLREFGLPGGSILRRRTPSIRRCRTGIVRADGKSRIGSWDDVSHPPSPYAIHRTLPGRRS